MPSVTDIRPGAAYQAAPGFLPELLEELRRRNEPVLALREDLVLVESAVENTPPAWSQNVWQEPVFIPVGSIADAAAKLRAVQPEADPIVTHRGVGYALQEDA